MSWPPRPYSDPDPTPLEFFTWGYVTLHVFMMSINELKGQIIHIRWRITPATLQVEAVRNELKNSLERSVHREHFKLPD